MMMKRVFLLFAVCFAAQITNAQITNAIFGKYIEVLAGGTIISSSALKDYSYPPDTLELWNYQFKAFIGAKTDSVKPLGLLVLWRNKPINDRSHFETYKSFPTPLFEFTVYNITDSAYCQKEALRAMLITSCLPPDIGGDYFIIGNYFFINYGLCIPCRFLGTDYCRPVLGAVLSHIDARRSSTLADIFKQFIIKAAKIQLKNGVYSGKDWRDE
jgi:hypothetical protein